MIRTVGGSTKLVCKPLLLEIGKGIPLNIAEGSARKGTRDYRKFLDTAWGSLAEVQTALVMARDIGYLRAVEFGRLEALATETSKTLFGLLRKISQAADRPKPR